MTEPRPKQAVERDRLRSFIPKEDLKTPRAQAGAGLAVWRVYGHENLRRGARMMARPDRPRNFAATVEERQRLVAAAFSAPELSVVIPIFNEEENIQPLCAKLLPTLRRLALRFEIIAVNDGSSDGSMAALKAAAADTPELRI